MTKYRILQVLFSYLQHHNKYPVLLVLINMLGLLQILVDGLVQFRLMLQELLEQEQKPALVTSLIKFGKEPLKLYVSILYMCNL